MVNPRVPIEIYFTNVDECLLYVWGCSWKPEEGVRSPGSGLTDHCDLPDTGAGTELKSSGRAVSVLPPSQLPKAL